MRCSISSTSGATNDLPVVATQCAPPLCRKGCCILLGICMLNSQCPPLSVQGHVPVKHGSSQVLATSESTNASTARPHAGALHQAGRPPWMRGQGVSAPSSAARSGCAAVATVLPSIWRQRATRPACDPSIQRVTCGPNTCRQRHVCHVTHPAARFLRNTCDPQSFRILLSAATESDVSLRGKHQDSLRCSC